MSNKYQFIGGKRGIWKVTGMGAYRGLPMKPVDRLDIVNGEIDSQPADTQWSLRGITSNIRYATAAEIATLRASQPASGRPEATCAALIPIKKSSAWWDLAQDERRAIFEETSHHTAIGLEYIPAVARRLHHSRDIGEPFDFLTWFEFAPEHKAAFEDLVARLRTTSEWNSVEREIDIRLERI